ncbi:MAG: thiamine pyrophosphate-binding protein [Rhizobiales bacterium]|nr:thiamine pyrophosphate-binding protein [Hyphomicrobiales bacterium]
MARSTVMRHGGQVLARQLAINGVERVFCVPGESYLAALDGLYETAGIATIICRQEGGAAMMAEADGKLTGRPGIVFVTRGPGATNASAGIHVARQDSTPLIMFIGLPSRDMQDREAFQEFDVTAVFGALAKHASVVPSADRIPEYVGRAFHIAMSGRPGPVVVGLPEDVISAETEVREAKPANPAAAHPSPGVMRALAERLAAAERPLLLVGGPGWSETVRGRIERFAATARVPVATAFRYQDYVDNRHPCYAGHLGIAPDPALAKRVRASDCLIVMGPRLGEMTTGGYSLLEVPNPETFLVHVQPGPDEIGRVYRADIAIAATADEFSEALAGLGEAGGELRAGLCEEAHRDYERFIVPQPSSGPVRLEQIMTLLSEALPADSIVTNGAGNYAGWLHRYYQWKQFRTQLAPTSGSMGYGVPAAIAAKLRHPERQVVALAGDGCFLMTAQEMATALQFDAPIRIIVVNNGMYGTIRMHQEREYPSRVMATSLVNPDFAAMARAFGGHGETVLHTGEFGPALERALAAETFSLIEIRTDGEAITPTSRLSQIREAAMLRQGS